VCRAASIRPASRQRRRRRARSLRQRTTIANPRSASSTPTTSCGPWSTLTGGQRDDDHDGYGNACDGDFSPTGLIVGAADLNQFRAANGKSRAGDTCGTTSTRPCAIFDLDGLSALIGSSDLGQWRRLNGRPAGPKCPLCPLACTAGSEGSCQ
jgi:hypothetical protein